MSPFCESVAISSIQFDFVRDVKPRECIIITKNEICYKNFGVLFEGTLISKQDIKTYTFKPCLFEYIYFARPESTIDGILVYQARKNMGEALANKIIKDYLIRLI